MNGNPDNTVFMGMVILMVQCNQDNGNPENLGNGNPGY